VTDVIFSFDNAHIRKREKQKFDMQGVFNNQMPGSRDDQLCRLFI